MPRPQSTLLTDREAEILTALWDLKTATAEEIRQRLSGQPHDSTVRTLLRVLVSKGHVLVDNDSRPAAYKPRVKQNSVRKKAAHDIVKRFFGGSAEDLVLHLLEDKRLSLEQLEELERKHRNRPANKEPKQ